jgi:hypothetical protein
MQPSVSRVAEVPREKNIELVTSLSGETTEFFRKLTV